MAGDVCLVPARGGSKRFPRKNVAPLRGRPLLTYSVEAALAARMFESVWVSTDDAEIATVAERAGAQVHPRPAATARDDSTLVDVSLDFLDWLAGKGVDVGVLGIVLPTAPLLRPDDLQGGLALLTKRNADAVMAVTSYLESPFQALHEVDGFLRLFFGGEYAVRSQSLPPVHVDSGAFYLVRPEALRRQRTLYVDRLVGYGMPRERSVDIDEPVHVTIAEALLALERGPV